MSSGFTSHQDSEYVWQLATLFPPQGEWTDVEYLDLTDHAKRRIEFTDGRVEFLSMPTEIHEALVRFLFLRLYEFVDREKDGEVYANGLRVRVRPGKYRLPDVLFLHRDHFHLRHNRVWDGADLVMEVVSDEVQDRQRDYEQKLADYAEAHVAECWIVDPQQRQLVIYHDLHEGRYQQVGEFAAGTRAMSVLLPGFSVDLSALWSAIEHIPE